MSPLGWPKLVGAVLAALLLYAAGYRAGGDHIASKWQASLTRIAAAQQRTDRAASAIDRKLAARDEARRIEFRRIYVEVPRVVEKPLYRNVWADADGVGLLRRGVVAANGELGGAPRGGADGGPAENQPAADESRRQR